MIKSFETKQVLPGFRDKKLVAVGYACVNSQSGSFWHLFVHPPEHAVFIVIVSVMMLRKGFRIVVIVGICLVA